MADNTSNDLTTRIASLPPELQDRAYNSAIVVAWEKLPLEFEFNDFKIKLQFPPTLGPNGWLNVHVDYVEAPSDMTIVLDKDRLYQWIVLPTLVPNGKRALASNGLLVDELYDNPELALKIALINVLRSTNGY